MKNIISVLFLSALSFSALAFEPVRGPVIDIAGGYTPSILAIDGGVSKSGYLGYKFNSIFFGGIQNPLRFKRIFSVLGPIK